MSDAAEIVIDTMGGRTFRASRRTWAHLEWTQSELTRRYPGAEIGILQGCFNTGVAASAGTHDKDKVVDFDSLGLDWPTAQRFLRECGWAAWWRNSGSWAAERSWHIHAVSLGGDTPVGIYVPGQVADYYAHRTGLAGHAADPTWHPADIASTIFDYPAWMRAQEDTMQDADWIKLRAVVREEIAAELDRTVDTKAGKRSVRQMVKETFQVVRGAK